MHRRGIIGIDHPARNLEGELGDSMAPLMDHHHLALLGQRDYVDPVGRVENEEVVLAAPRVYGAQKMQIEDLRAVCNVAGRAFPPPRLHNRSLSLSGRGYSCR